MSCRPAMLRGCKAGLFIHPVFLSLHFVLAQLTTKGKKNTITQPCRLKSKKAQEQERHQTTAPESLFILPGLVRSLKVKQSILNPAILYLEACLRNKPDNYTKRNTLICIVTALEKKKSF